MEIPLSVSENIFLSPQLRLWCAQRTAPETLWRGAAATDQNIAYFTPGGLNKVYRCILSSDEWQELPRCPYDNPGLVVIDNVLTTIGGGNASGSTNKAFTLRQDQWKEEFPPMTTARFKVACVSYFDGSHMNIIAIGGKGDGNMWTTAVEMLNTYSQTWSTLTNLPRPLPYPTATSCGDKLYVIEHEGGSYSCSLQVHWEHPRQMTTSTMWTSLPRLPVKHSTAATLCEQLVSVGGHQGGCSDNSILQLVDGQWVRIGSLPCGREMCLVVSPSPDKLVVVGGHHISPNTSTSLGTVESCTVVL